MVKNPSSDAEDTVQSQVRELRSNMPWAIEPTHHVQLERCPRTAVKILCATTKT